MFDGLGGLLAVGEFAVAARALRAAIAAAPAIGDAEAGTLEAYWASLEADALVADLGGPPGWVIAGVIAIAMALGFGIAAIVERVRADNTTTIVLVNGVANSSLSITGFTRTHGFWVGKQSDDGIKDIVAKGGAPGSFNTEALVFTLDGRSEGTLTGVIENGADSGTFGLEFKNDLGPRHQGPVVQKSSYSPLFTTGPISVVSQLSQPDTNSRNDIVVVNISPTPTT